MWAEIDNNVCDVVESSDVDVIKIGKIIILFFFFSVVLRYMVEKYLDIMVICCWYGKFYLCIIVVVNLNWVEFRYYFGVYGGEFINSRFYFEWKIFKLKFNEKMSDF